MKAVYGSLVVLAICFLVFEADACTTINRRNTIWLGNPGPDAAFEYVPILRLLDAHTLHSFGLALSDLLWPCNELILSILQH